MTKGTNLVLRLYLFSLIYRFSRFLFVFVFLLFTALLYHIMVVIHIV